MFVALSDRFLFLTSVRQIVVHDVPPRCEVSVLFLDASCKRFSGADAERILDCLSDVYAARTSGHEMPAVTKLSSGPASRILKPEPAVPSRKSSPQAVLPLE